MALSRMALVAPFAVYAAPAAAQPDRAEEAVAAQRREVRQAIAPECERSTVEVLVVCGRTEEQQEAESRRYRVAGTPIRRETAGNAQRDAMAANDQRCTPVGRAQQCNGGLDVIGIGFMVARAIATAAARRD